MAIFSLLALIKLPTEIHSGFLSLFCQIRFFFNIFSVLVIFSRIHSKYDLFRAFPAFTALMNNRVLRKDAFHINFLHYSPSFLNGAIRRKLIILKFK